MLNVARKTSFFTSAICFSCLLFAIAPHAVRADETKKTAILMTVGEMCGGCVKKITKRFEGVEGIVKIDCNIEKQSVTVIPKEGVRLSPKGVWEIMEGIGKVPKKMVTPHGTFTAKPKE